MTSTRASGARCWVRVTMASLSVAPVSKSCEVCTTEGVPTKGLKGSGTFHLPCGPVATTTASARTTWSEPHATQYLPVTGSFSTEEALPCTHLCGCFFARCAQKSWKSDAEGLPWSVSPSPRFDRRMLSRETSAASEYLISAVRPVRIAKLSNACSSYASGCANRGDLSRSILHVQHDIVNFENLLVKVRPWLFSNRVGLHALKGSEAFVPHVAEMRPGVNHCDGANELLRIKPDPEGESSVVLELRRCVRTRVQRRQHCKRVRPTTNNSNLRSITRINGQRKQAWATRGSSCERESAQLQKE
eukprot:2427542-Rhodomonas_salina.1